MSGFTPGPWKADDFLCDGEHALRIGMPDRNGVPTATIAVCEHNWNDCGQYDRRISWAEAEANARLIASAPDLLEALEGFISWGTKQCPCENEDPNPCPLCGASVENLETCKAIESKFPRIILAKARAAIAKALGEQS